MRALGRTWAFSYVPYQYVGWHYLVGERGHHFPAVIAQVDGDINRVFWHGHQEYVFEALGRGLGLGISEPFLEQGGKGVAIDDGLRLVVSHGHLPVALYGQLGQVLPLAIPSGHGFQFVHGDMLFGRVAHEGIVKSQGSVREIIFKSLRRTKRGHHQ